MIGVIAKGRMGNQMFQYAFGYAASMKLGTEFFTFGYDSLYYFKLQEKQRTRNSINIFLYILHILFKKNRTSFMMRDVGKPLPFHLSYSIRRNILNWFDSLTDRNYSSFQIRDTILYSGYFQSEKYFKEYEPDIRDIFEIQEQYQTAFLEKKQNLFNKKCVAVHLRRADYLQFGDEDLGGSDVTLPISYYNKCLEQIKDIDDYNVIFVSDDIAFAKKEFGTKENYFFESNEEIIDFQILLNADILIIANSTFSWWAAWLNSKAEKVIYAPNYFLGFKVKKFYPEGIKVDSWNWIDVN